MSIPSVHHSNGQDNVAVTRFLGKKVAMWIPRFTFSSLFNIFFHLLCLTYRQLDSEIHQELIIFNTCNPVLIAARLCNSTRLSLFSVGGCGLLRVWNSMPPLGCHSSSALQYIHTYTQHTLVGTYMYGVCVIYCVSALEVIASLTRFGGLPDCEYINKRGSTQWGN